MQILFGILTWLLFGFLGEFLFDVVGAFIMAVIETFWPNLAVRMRVLGPHLTIYALAGLAVGLLSIAFVPGPAPINRAARIASLALLPLASGLVVGVVGAWKDRASVRSPFLSGFAFGIGYAACRLLFAWARMSG